MWHSSCADVKERGFTPSLLESYARAFLDGAGDASRGEWVEVTDRAVHVRRRLSEAEEKIVPPVTDIRGTSEAEQRLEKVRKLLPPGWWE